MSQHDSNLIAERLVQEANERNWCEIFGEVVRDLNGKLDYPLPVERITARPTITVQATIIIELPDYSASKWAIDGADVAETFDHFDNHYNRPDSYAVLAAIREASGNWDYTSDTANVINLDMATAKYSWDMVSE